MSRLDIVEKRIPQDGRAVMHLRGKDIDMRISTLPTLYGEKVVIRILKRNEETLNRRGIGIPAVEDAKIDTLLGLTSGVIMIVGPTGSGKSSRTSFGSDQPDYIGGSGGIPYQRRDTGADQ